MTREGKPRPPYLHPDGEYISIGLGTEPDALLKMPEGEADRERAARWVALMRRLMGAADHA